MDPCVTTALQPVDFFGRGGSDYPRVRRCCKQLFWHGNLSKQPASSIFADLFQAEQIRTNHELLLRSVINTKKPAWEFPLTLRRFGWVGHFDTVSLDHSRTIKNAPSGCGPIGALLYFLDPYPA